MKFTPAQQRAITTLQHSIGIVAGAGSGKTGVLIARCQHILQAPECASQRILALTFTERAAHEMHERLGAVDDSRVLVSTFHGWCHRLLREHAVRAHLAPEFALLSAPEAELWLVRSIHDALLDGARTESPDVVHVLAHFRFDRVVERLEQILAQRAQLYARMIPLPFMPPAAALPNDIDTAQHLHDHLLSIAWRVLEHYRARKQQTQVVDFDDLEWHTLHLLRQAPDVLAQVQQQYRHLLIDECQDTNPIQLAIVRELYDPPNTVLCVVGDRKQSIYRFRGAAVECFDALLAHIVETGGELLYLQDNFRSHPQIVALANYLIPDLPDAEQLRATRDDFGGPGVQWLVVPTEKGASEQRDAEAAAVVCAIQEQQRAGTPLHDIVCLAATRTGFARYTSALRGAGIAVQSTSSQLLQQPLVADLLCSLRVIHGIATNHLDDGALLRVVRSPLWGWSADGCFRRLQQDPPPRGIGRLHALAERDEPRWAMLQRWVTAAVQQPVVELLHTILDESGISGAMPQIDPTGGWQTDCDTFIGFAHQLSHLALADFLTLARHYQRSGTGPTGAPPVTTNNDAVTFLTMHATKGNQFPVVILLDLAARPSHRFDPWHIDYQTGLLVKDLGPLADDDAEERPRMQAAKELLKAQDQAERDRLLYVAATRAQRLLIVPMAQPSGKSIPTWIGRLRTACEQIGVVASVICAAADVVPSPLVGEGQGEGERNTPLPPCGHLLPQGGEGKTHHNHPDHYTVSQLETFVRDPQEYQRRFVYGLPSHTPEWHATAQLSDTDRGSVIHAALQWLNVTHDPADWTITQQRAALDRAIAQLGLQPSSDLYPRLLGYLANAARWQTQQQHRTRHAEYPLQLLIDTPHGPTRIVGTIDLLAEAADGWHIVDYKTDHIRSAADLPRLREHYALQMAIYALAAARAGYNIIATHLLCLDAGEVITHPIGAAHHEQTAHNISELINKIL